MTSTDRETLLAQGGRRIDRLTGAVVPAIAPSVTFARGRDGELIGDHLYSRYGNPLVDDVEDLLRRLDGGAAAALFGSGLAATAAVLETVPSGTHVVAPRVMYHGAQDWLHRGAAGGSFDLTLFDASDPDGLSAAIRPGHTHLVWLETPVNPTWDVIDLAAASEVAKAAGAVLAVDSTAAPPVTQRPLEHGADLVVHSATKYLNGHSDVMAGVVVTARADDRWEEIVRVRSLSGGVVGPFSAWLLLRGLRTLHLRFARQSDSAMTIAGHLAAHPAVAEVLYPGLASHPGHDTARRQMTGGFGGMLSVRLRGGAGAARAAVERVGVWIPATSLGGVESLIEHRAAVEGPHSIVPDDLLRLSVGIENVDALVADLDAALG